ncbi:hypothetical protein L226DRAFT_566346 [Lentinus tigrinus ALCF2SS1-7]|uniref:Peptidase S9 prolyl oligopeptidase catalytic domain-containing protein n=1 Tax=Lentinus tigrinus ALCF2SS1-6 TaxID=1328759 RepID=A0A5C2SR81_9APHY|nr:hypothetical protein L227DRAFT_569783 [Lentinus tigrinus ALCF2SS1-6]RPD79776.1 hypothetical protein L226DRAFT_566346 [Lentinus tigrinus ALCF2SS1-7]
MVVTRRISLLLLLVLVSTFSVIKATSDSLGDAAQIVMGSSGREGWEVSVSTEWDVLGPFPIHAREQHFISPSFPLNLSHTSDPLDLQATYPSSYADGGYVGWTKAQSQEDGALEVSFPDIRWESLRATEGWAALQHHNLLRTTLTVYPPSEIPKKQDLSPPRLVVNLVQGSYFTVRPLAGATVESRGEPEWHMGNIYAMGAAPPNTVELPTPPGLTEPTTYELVVSGDYEIRLFGDPRHGGTEVPKLSITLTVGIEEGSPLLPVIRDTSHDISCDFVDGWAFGDAIGVGIRSLKDWWAVTSVKLSGGLSEDIELALLQDTRIAPSQTRIVPLKLTQTKAVLSDRLDFTVQLQSNDSTTTEEIRVSIPIRQHARWTSAEATPTALKASYFFGTSMPTSFLVSPPAESSAGSFVPPILALHGAGVDIFAPESEFWVNAIPQQRHSWVIFPSGRTAWGLDWHGPSTQEALATVDALHHILSGRPEWQEWDIAPDTKFLLMGHSNGGQGAWYLAARHPEKVIAVVPAAGYIKSQSYVPWVQSRSAHFVDPGLRAILDASLTPDDNDLFLSNLVDTPVLAIHGGDDDNVPVWHTREAVSVLKTWNPRANVTFREDPGQGHWYDNIFANDQVESFVSQALGSHATALSNTSRSFTLTVASPTDVGSLHGWRIHKIRVPGRLARLFVEMGPDSVRVRTINVKAFSMHIGSLPEDVWNVVFIVDGQTIELDQATWDLPDFTLALAQERGLWIPYAPSDIPVAPSTGRVANFLTTSAPIIIVIPNRTSSRLLSAALRIAHALDVYHKLDAEIIEDGEAARRLKEGSLGSGNMVILNSGELSGFATTIMDKRQTPFGVRGGTLELRGRLLNESSMATLFLHPHPVDATSLVLFLYGADLSGLERGLRLVPIRTGVTVPDWIVIGALADERGSGGVDGAGVWGNDWSWNEAMSAF